MSTAGRFPAQNRPCVELPDDEVIAVLRQKTLTERVAMVFDAEHTMRLMLDAHLRWRHPDWNAGQVANEIARRRLGEPG